MNDEPHEIWFYSHGSERLGPVSFTALRALAKDAELDPRHDLVWSKGMDTWRPAGEIDGLFNRRVAAEVAAEAAAPPLPDPYQSPREESAADPMATTDVWPGARRRSYIIATVIFPVVWGVVIGISTGFLSERFGPETMTTAAFGLSLVPVPVSIYFALQRLVNLGMSRWWFLGNFVPFLNIWVAYRSFVCPAGYAYHKKLDGAGIFLAIVFWLVVVLALVVIATIVGAIGSPEFQQQFLDALRRASESKP